MHFYDYYPFSSPVQVHVVRGTSVLQQHVDRQQLPVEMGGDFSHCHSDWLAFRLVRIFNLNVYTYADVFFYFFFYGVFRALGVRQSGLEGN